MSEQEQAAAPGFNIEKIYLKDLSVEVPNAPQIFLEQTPPQIDVQLRNQSEAVDEGIYQTTLTAVVNAKIGDKTAFLVEAHQAGIFRVQNLPQEALEPMLAVGCPNILFPYLRETVSDAAARAGFPALYLQPVNFEAIYLQQRAQAQAQAQPKTD
ncbi:MAG: protein-export chaperone SecB [Hydrogenophilales bacterium CG03_land_8_20_14_0_80_62_28]|nr:protein-export chaperone SecB [Betaproteobacteria bacterium]OIO79713.1 MAG: protein-export chaperone SecB [Hydrogenophilaceae bacterium CG1_02_62_390]PIV23501.1 MAG: protein-export chaperone SecB [Hydrogenophilales bacterium CG03_land_8_20_14_0_80_62_28]PIW38795.1 MAG: protein-export chaperone SecB [Hydrogenophilales bacterium CG15_BIG_FIL_POST_REV_8_21_14_020_62_31]PIW71704.1 MAG: protein-export chaperone SecB [Hydrogenophilales bacterium CG12_big_fil_rev_8_21_14_0_65_61_21]PIX00716.1 MAG: